MLVDRATLTPAFPRFNQSGSSIRAMVLCFLAIEAAAEQWRERSLQLFSYAILLASTKRDRLCIVSSETVQTASYTQ